MINKPKYAQLWTICFITSTVGVGLLATLLLAKPFLNSRRYHMTIAQQQQLQHKLQKQQVQCQLLTKKYHELAQKNPSLTQTENLTTEQLIIDLNQQHYRITHFEQNKLQMPQAHSTLTLTLSITWAQFIRLFNQLEKKWSALSIQKITLTLKHADHSLQTTIQLEEKNPHV